VAPAQQRLGADALAGREIDHRLVDQRELSRIDERLTHVADQRKLRAWARSPISL